MQSRTDRQHDSVVTLILLRHGLTERTGSTLAGREPGLHLDDRGIAQAKDVARRLAGIDLTAVVSSPLERCQETAGTVAAASGREVVTDDRFVECDYGDWTGRRLKDLAEDPLWRVVQAHPAAVRFPGGESLAEMASRAIGAVRAWNERLAHTPSEPVYLVCSHGDVIKAIVADALGLHLDLFQRLQIDPGSLTTVRYTAVRPFVLRLNDVGESNANLLPDHGDSSGDATVGGGAGAAAEESPR